MSGNGSSSWKDLYAAAFLELDKSKLPGRIYETKMAVCDHAEELNGRGSESERAALGRALKVLHILGELYCENGKTSFSLPSHRKSLSKPAGA